jgi:RhoGEF domain
VKTLEQGIQNYVVPMDNPDLPEDLREAKVKVFGNITEIHELHANTLYPALVSCGYDIVKISETFDSLIADGYFYCYLLFSLNQDQAVTLSAAYSSFFQDLQKATKGEKLGVGSFLLQPIQRVPRYQLLLGEMIKTLIKNRQEVDIKPYVKAICKTEKSIERLLKLNNESLSIKEISPATLVSLIEYF